MRGAPARSSLARAFLHGRQTLNFGVEKLSLSWNWRQLEHHCCPAGGILRRFPVFGGFCFCCRFSDFDSLFAARIDSYKRQARSSVCWDCCTEFIPRQRLTQKGTPYNTLALPYSRERCKLMVEHPFVFCWCPWAAATDKVSRGVCLGRQRTPTHTVFNHPPPTIMALDISLPSTNNPSTTQKWVKFGCGPPLPFASSNLVPNSHVQKVSRP
jgi:hypothetical protein